MLVPSFEHVRAGFMPLLGRVMRSWKIVVGLGAEIPFGSVRGLRIPDIHPAGVITSEYVGKTSLGPTSTTLPTGYASLHSVRGRGAYSEPDRHRKS